MSIRKTSLAGVLMAAGMAVSSLTMAQAMPDAGWYLGGSLGQSQADLDCTGATSCDDKDSSWKIFAGYQMSRNLAVEFGYTSLGEVTASTPSFFLPGFGTIPSANISIESSVWEVSGVGSLPVADRFSFFGRAGLYMADTDVSLRFAGPPGVVDDSDDNIGLTLGFGARVDLTRNLGIRAEWQRYMDVSAGDFDESDVDVMALSLVWRF
jgi:OOP family OmpA-OmpF porin